MKTYKILSDGYITAVCKASNNAGEEITETEYNTILNIIRNKPQRTETTDYRLREDLTWEEVEIQPEPEPEPEPEELLNILLGVSE